MLPGHDSVTVTMAAAAGGLADAGVRPRDVDGVVGALGPEVIYQYRMGPVWRSLAYGIPGVLEAAAAIAAGLASVVLVCDGMAGAYTDHGSTAPWTRPANEYTAPFGLFTAAEFALVARRHMHVYGTRPESLAHVAATIRNNGSAHPGAVYRGRGPFTPQDIVDSRMVADPYHLLDCATTSEGGCALVLARGDIARDLPRRPVWILGGNTDRYGPQYEKPPSFELGGKKRADLVNGWVGRRAAEQAFASAGLRPEDVDVCEFYDPFSFEIIRQFEAFGFCKEGEGGDFVLDGVIAEGGRHPVTTDGGTMSFSHSGSAQMLQRVARAVEQLRGTCASRQVSGAEVAMCTGTGSGAMANDVLLLGVNRP
jgi:acetyl-CoA acetyltransferase